MSYYIFLTTDDSYLRLWLVLDPGIGVKLKQGVPVQVGSGRAHL